MLPHGRGPVAKDRAHSGHGHPVPNERRPRESEPGTRGQGCGLCRGMEGSLARATAPPHIRAGGWAARGCFLVLPGRTHTGRRASTARSTRPLQAPWGLKHPGGSSILTRLNGSSEPKPASTERGVGERACPAPEITGS